MEIYPCPNCYGQVIPHFYGTNGLTYIAVCPNCKFSIGAEEKTVLWDRIHAARCLALWNKFSQLKGFGPFNVDNKLCAESEQVLFYTETT